jgi:hypothetical protein
MPDNMLSIRLMLHMLMEQQDTNVTSRVLCRAVKATHMHATSGFLPIHNGPANHRCNVFVLLKRAAAAVIYAGAA